MKKERKHNRVEHEFNTFDEFRKHYYPNEGEAEKCLNPKEFGAKLAQDSLTQLRNALCTK